MRIPSNQVGLPIAVGTIGDFKELTKDLPDDTVIVLEGCDCDGYWGGTILRQDNERLEQDEILLLRPHHE